jgi:hypothetical protein
MRKIKTYVSLALGAVMSVSLLAGCSADELTWFKAVNKAQSISSMETKTDMSLSISASNMTKNEEQAMQQFLPVINGAKLSMTSKTVRNANNTSAKMESEIGVSTKQMSINTGLWVDSDATGNTTKVKEIFRIPEVLNPMLPKELKGKQYLVMDTATMAGQMQTAQIDSAKLTEFSKEFQQKYLEFMDKYVQQYKPSFDIITKKGKENIVQPTGTVQADIYELSLNDTTFKELIKYSVNNFATNKDALEFVNYTLNAITNFVQLPEDQSAAAKAEMIKSFEQFKADIPKYLETFNKSFDTIKDLKIIGDKGIKIRYAVNADGYIINETGTVDLVLDLDKISKLSGENTGFTGTYNLTIDFSNDIYNINKAIEVKFPELTEANSIDYMKFLQSMMPKQEDIDYSIAVQAVQHAKQTKVFSDYNNAYAYIVKLSPDKQAALLDDLSPLWKDVYTEDIASVLGEMKDFAGNKDIKRYNALLNKINAEVKRDENKGYLLGELTSWGQKGVYTPDVVKAIDAIKAAWTKKDAASIEAATTAINEVTNTVTREWLVEQLDELKATIK